MIQRFNKRERTLLTLILTTAMTWLFIAFVIEPAIKDNEQLRDMIKSRTLQYLKLQKIVGQKNRFTKEFAKLSKLEKPNPGEIDNSRLLRTIDEIQKKVGIQIENIAPIEPEVLTFYKRLLVKVEINDSMENIIRFIAELKESPFKLNLVNLTLVPGIQDNLKASLTVAELRALK